MGEKLEAGTINETNCEKIFKDLGRKLRGIKNAPLVVMNKKDFKRLRRVWQKKEGL